MQTHGKPVRAAIDIGSNTVHVVVAECAANDLHILADEEEMVRIGESVTATGKISPQKRDDTIAVLLKYKALAEEHRASPILIVATEAIRQAENSAEFLADIKRETDLEVHMIDGHVEATLTFFGATYELYQENHAPAQVIVMDLGGGSTELVLAKNAQITWSTSIPLGSGWLHDRYFRSDPPSYDDLSVARSFLHTYFQGMRIKYSTPVLIATGGSANALFFLAQHAFGFDESSKGMTYDDLLRCEGLLSALRSEEVAARYQVPVKRARILAAGVIIIRAVMERFKLDEIRISPHGIREGALLAYQRYGERWLDAVKSSGESSSQANGGISIDKRVVQGAPGETFVESGRRMIQEHFKKMMAWRDDVLKQKDVEAVHKMRVASRRLRAVLDAYEAVCAPKPFRKAYRCVKQTADMLGKARDTDVMILNMRQKLATVSSEEQAGIQWLIDRLSDYRQQHQKIMQAYLNKLDEDALKRWLKACLPEGEIHNGKSQTYRQS